MHGGDTLGGPGEWGKIEFLDAVELTVDPDTIADGTVSPDGNTAFVANWGEPDCAGPKTGGQTSPDAGAHVVDISDIETDPTSAEKVGFIPSHQDTRPGEGMQVIELTTSRFTGEVLVMNNESCGKNGKGGGVPVGRHRSPEPQQAFRALRRSQSRQRWCERAPGGVHDRRPVYHRHRRGLRAIPHQRLRDHRRSARGCLPLGDRSGWAGACNPGRPDPQRSRRVRRIRLPGLGAGAVLFVNHHTGEAAGGEPFCGSGAFVDEIVAVCTTHEAFHLLFELEPFDQASWTYPEDLAIGTIGAEIEVGSTFDGWGYVHLFDAETLEELDTFAIPEAHDPEFAFGMGDVTVHEVAVDPQDASLVYLSYYSGGLRAVQIQCADPAHTSTCELVEVGGYLDPEGNDFWGVETFIGEDGRTYILGSDMDSGLWIFRDP